MAIVGEAFARAGLLGNPSDGYFGKTISVTVGNFRARVSLHPSPMLRIEEHDELSGVDALVERVERHGYYGGKRLVEAAIKRFVDHCRASGIELRPDNFTVRYETDIPRQVGLAGSSAIIVATLRALMAFYGVEIPLPVLPGLTLQAETVELGILAGLQDRVVQAFEGLVYMDFDRKGVQSSGGGAYERLDASRLPRLYLAYDTNLGKISGTMFHDLRQRFEAGDAFVIQTLERLAGLAEAGKQALADRDVPRLKRLMNENFDLRRSIMPISDANLELVETARQCGASAKFAGSGGSIVGVVDDDAMFARLVSALEPIQARVVEVETDGGGDIPRW
jgi:glucuronokinase